jgi:hypothetical protein
LDAFSQYERAHPASIAGQASLENAMVASTPPALYQTFEIE